MLFTAVKIIEVACGLLRIIRPGKFDSQFIIQHLRLHHAGGSSFFITHYYLSVSLSGVEKDF